MISEKIFYGYGYRITDDDVKNLGVLDTVDLTESRWHYPVNNLTPSNEAFFGIVLKEIEPNGELYEVPIATTYPFDEFQEMVKEYKSFFPNKSHYVAKNYVCYSIL